MSMASNRLQQKITLPDRVSQLYYAHGLFCSSHPVLVLSCAAFVVLLCCYPLLSIPLPGNAPQQLVGQPSSHNSTESENYSEQASLPRWLSGPPLLYVHQILLRVAVCPWAEDLLLTDAFRAPLSEVFRLLESVANYQHENSSRTLSDVCLHVESAARLKPEQRALLPEYNCLMLSPASLWRQEPGRFLQDPTPLHTVFNYQTLQRGKVSLAEMLLGLNLKDTGIKRYPLRSRQRVLQYAVTLFLRVHDSSFMDGLHHKLRQMYPFHQQTVNSTGANNSAFSIEKNTFDQLPMIHIYYPGEFSARGLIPLIATYLLMFLYMYFSMRKIELLKSKFGVSVSAALTVLASLFMSVGLCFFFGLTLTLSGREFYPYLVVIVGLENVFVLTKSVVSTPAHLDVKIRVAQGLSREGWSITKNLLTEVTILTIGLFTLVPAIQEFCIFAIVGLLSDFFLQVVFFSTILAMDIRRAALDSVSQSQNYHSSVRQYNPQASRQAQRSTLSRSRSHPRLDLGDYPTSVVAPPIGPTYASTVLVPKRLRLVHFWARTRIVQRGFMLFMILWIGAIAINSGVVEQLLEASVTSSQTDTNTSKTPSVPAASWKIRPADPSPIMHLPTPLPIDDQSKVSCPRLWSSSPWPHTSPQHWSSILSLYNISIAGNYLTVLPPLRLAMAVSPDRARTLRRPGDEDAGGWSGAGAGQWQALVAALDPVDLSSAHDSSVTGGTSHHSSDGSAPFVPQSPMELLLTAILCIVSVGVLAYTTVVLYRCICSRHYAEWRAGWSNSDNEGVAAEKQVVLREAVPLILDGHNQQVEWICSDSGLICSSCLGGHLRAWDGQSGELLAAVDRTRFFAGLVKQKTPTCSSVSFEDLPLSDYESGSPPSRGDPGGPQDFNPTVKSSIGFGNFPDLRSSICTNFTSSGYSPSQPVDSKQGYDFGDRYSSIFEDFFAQNTSPEDLGEWGTTGLNCVQIKSSPPTPIPITKNNNYSEHQQSYNRRYDVESGHFSQDFPAVESLHFTGNPAPPVWCLDFKDNLLVAGCSNGRLEFWEASTGTFKCIFDDGCGVPVTGVKLVGNRVVVAKLNGAVDFLELESFGSQGRPLDWGFTSIRRTHVRSGSTGSLSNCLRPADAVEDDVRCRRLHTVRAHQQPITVLDSEGGRVVTGSQDHTLKIFRLEDQRPLYTLHGHCGPITCLFIDCMSPLLSGSGSQDGMLCVWDLLTGACMYSIQAHDGAVSSVTYSASYVITVGADERICVWERFQGHLLNTIILGHSYCSSMVMLTHNLLVTSKQGSLIVWDVRTGEAVRVIRLGGRPSLTSSGSSGGCGILVKQIVLIQPGDSIACDYGNEVRVVRFPVASDKVD